MQQRRKLPTVMCMVRVGTTIDLSSNKGQEKYGSFLSLYSVGFIALGLVISGQPMDLGSNGRNSFRYHFPVSDYPIFLSAWIHLNIDGNCYLYSP